LLLAILSMNHAGSALLSTLALGFVVAGCAPSADHDGASVAGGHASAVVTGGGAGGAGGDAGGSGGARAGAGGAGGAALPAGCSEVPDFVSLTVTLPDGTKPKCVELTPTRKPPALPE
jgi:hypothetical protein